ncbi:MULTISPECIES: T9SS type A sorting domain-containing protein [unclassified Carboxylicivirga]|uniref:T9SS type A sorting domain-containing protein n=1 Tax=Carboxylicivirga TaxID=1628153 RepID=UPI003D32555C
MMKKFTFLLLLFLASNMSINAQMLLTLEAENATLSDGYSIVSKEFASGGSFVKLKNSSPQGSLVFTVANVDSAGTYKLHVFSFNGGSTVDALISVNGGAATTIAVQPSNWAYLDSAKVTYLDVDLVAGNNTIALTATSATNVLVDKIVVSEYFNDYYFSESGNDANDGSIDSPWRTLAKATAITNKTSNGGIVLPGDKILFKSGDTFEGNFLVKCSGTVDRPIEISSYGIGELPILSGSGTIEGGDYFEAIKLVNTSNIVVSKLWVKNDRQVDGRYTWGETNAYGILVYANKWGGVSSNLTFRDLKITDVFGLSLPADFDELNVTGLRFDSDSSEVNTEVSIKDVLIENCYFNNIGKAGVWSVHKGVDGGVDSVNRSANFIIRNNTFYKTGGSGIILSKVYNALVENNDFDHSGYSDGIETRLAGRGSGMWVFKCVNVVGQYNRSISVRGSGDSYGMHIDFGNKNIFYQYNYSEDSEGGFCEVLGDNHNVTYRFNVSVNDGFRDNHGCTIWTSGYVGTGNSPVPSNDVYVYNNSIYLDANRTPDFSLFSENTYIYNNIFKQTGSGMIGQSVDIDIQNDGEFIVSNNLFSGNISSIFKNYDSNPVNADPMFVNEGATNINGYTILSGSPAIDAGTTFPEPVFPMAGQGIFKDVTMYPTFDIYGNDIDLSSFLPNIGADNNYNSKIDPLAVNVLNHDFEQGLQYWNTWGTGTVTTETSTPFAGTSSLKVVGYGGVNQWINTKPATDYQVTFTAKVDNASIPVKFTMADANNVAYFTQDIVNTNYTEHTISFKTKANHETSKIGFWRPSGSIGGAYLDNISIVESTLKSAEIATDLIKNVNEQEVIVYPNPTSDKMTVLGLLGETSLLIYNLMGSQVLSQMHDANKNGSATISVNHLAKGTYLLIVTDETGKRVTKKLVIK